MQNDILKTASFDSEDGETGRGNSFTKSVRRLSASFSSAVGKAASYNLLSNVKGVASNLSNGGSSANYIKRPSNIPNQEIDLINVLVRGNPIITEILPTYHIRKDIVTNTFHETVITTTRERRTHKIRKTIMKMTASGVLHSYSKKVPNVGTISVDFCASGSEMIEFCMNQGEFETRHEALEYLQICQSYGYIISLEYEQTFKDDSIMYTIQEQSMWPNLEFQPSESDYVCYLIRRDRFMDPPLNTHESGRYVQFHKRKGKEWLVFQKRVSHQIYLLEQVSFTERYRFKIHEFGFWNFYCPCSIVNQIDIDLQVDREKNSEKSKTEDEYESCIKTDEERLDYWTEKVQHLNSQVATNHSKISTASNSLLRHVEIFQDIDPLVDPDRKLLYADTSSQIHQTTKNPYILNPWHKTDEKLFNQEM